MSTMDWVLLGVLLVTLMLVCLTALAVWGVRAALNGHFVLLILGVLMPFLWFFGARKGPTSSVAAGEARKTLREA